MHRPLDQRSQLPQSMLPDLRVPDMPFHPLAELFPLPSEDELCAMADDIAAHGLREPIVTLEGKILDGRCRHLACKMAAVEPQFENYAGNDPVAYVLSRNACRRHMSESQRAMVAARVANLKIGANQRSEGLSIGRAAQLLNVSERSVARAKEIIRRGAPELVQAVESGDVSVSAAVEIIRVPKQEQGNAAQYGDLGTSLALPDSGSELVSQSSLITAPAEANSRSTHQDETATSTKRFPGWLWGDVIPRSSVTVIVGGAATMPVAIKIAATVVRGGDWPDYSPASHGGIIWMSAVTDIVHHQIAPPVPTFSVHLMPPERDDFGLPIRHFAYDLGRLRGQIEKTTGVVLVTLDTLSDYVRCGDVEQAIKDLHGAIQALDRFAIENKVAIVLPCELPMRDRTAASRAANAFTAIPEITTVFVAGTQSKLTAVKLPTGNGIREFGFRVRCRNSVPTLVWDRLGNDTMSDTLFDFEQPAQFTTPAVDAEHQRDAGGDDHANAIPRTTPDPPITSELLAHTSDAAAAANSELSKATLPNMPPQVAHPADAGTKNKSIEFVSCRFIGGRHIPVLRHRTHGKAKKASPPRQPE
jgi:hypothetical protein